MSENEYVELPEHTYVAVSTVGSCKICHKHKDLRYGVCFACSPQVNGHPIPGGHELWDTKNPLNRWKVKTN